MHIMHNSVKHINAHSAFVVGRFHMHNAHMNNLAALRDLRGLTQQQLAEMVGLNQSTIQRAEREHPSAKLVTFRVCADALGVSMSQIFGNAHSELHQELYKVLEGVPKERIPEVKALLKLVSTPPHAVDE